MGIGKTRKESYNVAAISLMGAIINMDTVFSDEPLRGYLFSVWHLMMPLFRKFRSINLNSLNFRAEQALKLNSLNTVPIR